MRFHYPTGAQQYANNRWLVSCCCSIPQTQMSMAQTQHTQAMTRTARSSQAVLIRFTAMPPTLAVNVMAMLLALPTATSTPATRCSVRHQAVAGSLTTAMLPRAAHTSSSSQWSRLSVWRRAVVASESVPCCCCCLCLQSCAIVFTNVNDYKHGHRQHVWWLLQSDV